MIAGFYCLQTSLPFLIFISLHYWKFHWLLVTILQGYAANIDSSEMQHLVPPELHDNQGLLFDNIELIHQFHSG
jgi:hypothetical protein